MRGKQNYFGEISLKQRNLHGMLSFHHLTVLYECVYDTMRIGSV